MSVYLGSNKVGYTINESDPMTLPTAATSSATSGFTQKAAITPGSSDLYLNIPVGYNDSGAYYKINTDANLIASNIISGKTIFGVSGSVILQTVYTGSSEPSAATGSDGDIYIKS